MSANGFYLFFLAAFFAAFLGAAFLAGAFLGAAFFCGFLCDLFSGCLFSGRFFGDLFCCFFYRCFFGNLLRGFFCNLLCGGLLFVGDIGDRGFQRGDLLTGHFDDLILALDDLFAKNGEGLSCQDQKSFTIMGGWGCRGGLFLICSYF